MVKHVAYAGDSEHEQWRVSHSFPAEIAFTRLKEHEPRFVDRQAIMGHKMGQENRTVGGVA
jgi:hypothetical protein